MAKTFRVSLKYPDGTTMFMGTILAEEVPSADPGPPAKPQAAPIDGNPAPQHSANGANGERGSITEKQIKALYAIVRREQKLTVNDQISKWLREHFRVRRLDDIARDVATAYIKQHELEGSRAPGA
jgi:hypothetical protein